MFIFILRLWQNFLNLFKQKKPLYKNEIFSISSNSLDGEWLLMDEDIII